MHFPKSWRGFAALALVEGCVLAFIGLFQWFGMLFSAEGFVPRWHCGDWHPFHVYTDVGADLIVAVAYFGIPSSVVWFARSTREAIPPDARWVPFAFANFIFWCGMTHLNGPLPYWWPAYRWFTFVKVMTALSSLPTFAALVPTVRHAARMVRHARANYEDRERMGRVLADANEQLMGRVRELEKKLERGSDEMDVISEVERLYGILDTITGSSK